MKVQVCPAEFVQVAFAEAPRARHVTLRFWNGDADDVGMANAVPNRGRRIMRRVLVDMFEIA